MRSIDTFIALNRFGLGAAPGEGDRVASDPRGWADAQVGRVPMPEALMRFRSSADIIADMHRARKQGPATLRPAVREALRRDFGPEVMARARHHIATDRPFAERLVLFWSNHFTVSRAKGIIGAAVPAFEREVIRPHVFGRFTDMLRAATRHPAMIAYLDNQVSIGERSRVGRRRMERKGNAKTLNENLAREILELHTLGVNGGYAQSDVMELARAITGWSHGGMRFGRDARPIHGEFEFQPNFHEPGPKTVLGITYREDGAEEGLAILDDLAHHPSTADFIATKLVRHFVADDPPAGAVRAVARTFLETDGDLAAVSRALVRLDAAWANPLAKVKSHYEFVIAVNRATGNAKAKRPNIMRPLRELGQQPFMAPSPAGWGDTAATWIAPEALMRRIEWVRRYAATLPPTLRPDALLEETVGAVADDSLRRWVDLAPSGDAGIAMVLASPVFQRR